MSIRIIALFILAALMLTACIAASGCGSGKEQPAEQVISWSSVPEEYWDMFSGGSFDEDDVWFTDDGQYADMLKEMKAYCKENYPGTIVLATDERMLFAGGWNGQDTDGGTVDPFTVYEAGSYTKQITAAAVLQLVEQGRLSLDDTLDKFFPQCPNIADATVGNLVDMNAGIPEFLDTMKFFKGCSSETKEAFAGGTLPDEEVLAVLSKLHCNAPGLYYEYCNTNFWLLALVIEQVTGQPYDEYITAQILEPCGMENTSSCAQGDVTIVPYQEDAAFWKYCRNMRGAGDIHTTACDILRWDREFFSGSVLSPEMMTYVTDREGDYSCGWMKQNGGEVFTHSGVTDACSLQTTVYRLEGGNVYLIQLLTNPRKGPQLHEAMKIVEEFLQVEKWG